MSPPLPTSSLLLLMLLPPVDPLQLEPRLVELSRLKSSLTVGVLVGVAVAPPVAVLVDPGMGRLVVFILARSAVPS